MHDAWLRDRLAHRGKAPNLALVVHVGEAFLHCPKALVRAGLWRPETWSERSEVPCLAEAMVAHGRLADTSVPDMQAIIDRDGAMRLH
ncbi:hypothetical protein [Ferruginivarius sediminum]|uniref:Uncharacterized protein n=1 Tax=Ferruginivarius sediminum TaxID=2661937 RepID=A0A369THV3_9PROT|nr:hypothetical protein [Ferruginivarius sediminum]RDD62476.1 hypothetical protein DRB17_07440 [Ferruginivarius sediminum]